MTKPKNKGATYLIAAGLLLATAFGAAFGASPEKYVCLGMCAGIGLISLGLAWEAFVLVGSLTAAHERELDRYQHTFQFMKDAVDVANIAIQELADGSNPQVGKALELSADLKALAEVHKLGIEKLSS